MPFTLKRWGEFVCYVKPGTPHCGPDDQIQRIFKYSITCKTNDDALDHEGFIIDNLAVSAYFDNKCGPQNPVTVSCENFARQAALDLYGMLPVSHACHEVDVTITPFAGAEITYHYRKEDSK
jgi:hypothetical protein